MKKLLIALVLVFAIGGTAMAAVNINTATKEELTSLKGIGDKRAEEIINYRTKHGPFKTVDDLGKVPGIGPGILKQIRPNVTVSGKTVVEPAGDTKTKAEAKKSEPAKGRTKTDDKSSTSSSDKKTGTK
jgi:competence protein ComEA